MLFELPTQFSSRDSRAAILVAARSSTSSVEVGAQPALAIQQALRQTEEAKARYHDLLDHVPVCIFRAQADATILEINHAGVEMLRFPDAQSLKGFNVRDLYADAEDFTRLLALLERDGVARDFEARMRRHDGQIIWASTSIRAIEDAEHRLTSFEGVSEDVTERRRADETRARLAAIVDSSDDAIIGQTLDGIVTSWNPGAERVHGFSAAEMIGHPISQIMAPERRHEMVEIGQRIARGEHFEHYETERVCKDGRRITISLSASPIFDTAGRIVGVATIARDVTERNAAEDAVRESQRLVDGFFDSSPAGMSIMDRDLRYLRVNEPLALMNGSTVEGHIGRTVHEVLPKTARSVEVLLQKVLESGQPMLNVEVSGETRSAPGALRQWLESFFPLLDATGRTAALGAVVLEVTDLRDAEKQLRRALAKAEESDRLKSAFLANMSHEVRTPLHAILGFNSLIADRLGGLDVEGLDSDLAAVGRASQRLLKTIQGIIDLSLIETGTFETRPEVIDLGHFVELAVEESRSRAQQKNLSLTCGIEVADAKVRADSHCLQQSFDRLLDNAIKFTERGGITVRVHRDSSGALCLVIRDSGVGIDPGYLVHLFEPFSQEDSSYTRRFEGTGIGLALTKRYLALNHAEIAITSEKGEGTTSTIRFRSPEHSMTENP